MKIMFNYESQGGGIGRRAAFRSQWPRGREGSNPSSGTIFLNKIRRNGKHPGSARLDPGFFYEERAGRLLDPMRKGVVSRICAGLNLM